MGRQIGRLWGQAGHEVMFSSRNPKKLVSLTEGLKYGHHGAVTEAIEFGEVILLAINYWTVAEAIEQLRGTDKIIIDLTNPYKWSESGGLERVIDEGISGAESLQNELKTSTIVKAFSSHQANSLAKHHSNPKISVFYTCNNENGKQVAETLIEDAGFAPVYYGGLDKSIDIELFGTYSNKLMTLEEAKNEINQ